ncbi:MAG: hypothetical protein PHE36_01450, partial [Novosphingobium sp.]|nr:hypothetical protein [Novosphingobium sp.]
GTQIRLRMGDSQADVDGASAPYDSGAVDFIDPAITDEDGLYHSHLRLPSTETRQWWRIDITGHTGTFEASMLVLGKSIQPSRFYNLDYEYGADDLGDGSFTPHLIFDETPGEILRTIDFTLDWQTRAEFESYFRPIAERLGRRGIVYCCFNPAYGVYRQAQTYMGVLDKPPFARGKRKPETFGQEFKILSFI